MKKRMGVPIRFYALHYAFVFERSATARELYLIDLLNAVL
jgi:hypothetical protein